MRQDAEPPVVWAIRPTARADTEILAASIYVAENAGVETASAWLKGLKEEIAKLAQLPMRWPVAEEDKLFRENVRRLLYRRTPSGPAYRVLFTLRENPDDAPTVTIIHVCHAAQKPMTRKEAKEIEASE